MSVCSRRRGIVHPLLPDGVHARHPGVRVVLHRHQWIEAVDVLLHLTVVLGQLMAAEVGPLLEEGVGDGGERGLVHRRGDVSEIVETQPLLQQIRGVFFLEKLPEILDGHGMKEHWPAALRAGVVEVDQVHLEVLHRHADHFADVFLVAGMGEIDPFPEGLGAAVMDRLSQVVGHEPGFGLRLLQQEGLVSHGAPHVHAHPDAVLAAQFGQLPGVGQVLSLGLEPEALVEVEHGHGDAQFLQLEDPLLGVSLLVRLVVPGPQAAHPPPKERHVVPAPHDDDGLLVEPSGSFRTRRHWRTLTRFGSRPARTGKQQNQNQQQPRHRANFHLLPRLPTRIEQERLRIPLGLPQFDRPQDPIASMLRVVRQDSGYLVVGATSPVDLSILRSHQAADPIPE